MKRSLGLLLCVSIGCTGKYIRETTQEVIEPTPERLQRGEYLVNQVTYCGACHTTRDSGELYDSKRSDMFLGGGNVDEAPSMGLKIWIPNISGDIETGVGSWSDDELLRGVRDGVTKDGRLMFPIMPFGNYQYMSDDDARAVVAYLRTVPKVKQPKPRAKNEVPFMMGMMMGMGVAHHPPAKEVKAPPREDKVAYGEYLGRLGDCTSCHSMGGKGPYGKEDERYMGGGYDFAFEHPRLGKVHASNLSSDEETGLGNYSADQLKQALRTGYRLDGKQMAPPMSLLIGHVSQLTEEDMDALVTWLKSLKPVKHKIPERELTPEMKAKLGEG
ncbi:MAG: cytochrome c [Myxococcales bacterium]|nr:cytochrome c [Myxococcales bacterium]